MRFSSSLLLALSLTVAAHPGEHEEHDEVAALGKREFNHNAARGLERCANHPAFKQLKERAANRRREVVALHGKKKRDTDTILAKSHKSSKTGVTADTAASDLFSSSPTCILNPEGEVGPYRVQGEHIRSDLRESQPGVPIIIDGQFINVETCQPITNLYWDVWNCNATGVYSGIVAQGNGNTADASNINTTFLRGLQKTDSDGVVQFLSIFPGHYSGRTTHHHMVAWLDAQVLSNNTLSGGKAAHIGQIFWDQDLINEVEATAPYNTNTATLTTNAEDKVVSDETSTDSDPFLEYVKLGDSLSDGVFGWVTLGINVSASYDAYYSFALTSSGGVAVDGGSSGSGGAGGAPSGGPGGNGTRPGSSGTASGTGATASGTAASTSVAVSGGSSLRRRWWSMPLF